MSTPEPAPPRADAPHRIDAALGILHSLSLVVLCGSYCPNSGPRDQILESSDFAYNCVFYDATTPKTRNCGASGAALEKFFTVDWAQEGS